MIFQRVLFQVCRLWFAYLILSMFLLNTGVYSQVRLNIVDTTLVGDYQEELQKLDLVKDSVFYEDELYMVRKTCSGEWGGSVWFKNKKTGLEYSCEATCPVSINRLNGDYYVTSSLAHLMGMSKVIKIDNPDLLEVFKMPKPRRRRWRQKFYYIGDDESKSKKGTITLADSVGVLILSSFVHQNQLIHILSGYKKVFLSRIEENKFVNIGTILNLDLSACKFEMFKTIRNSIIVSFINEKEKGYLEIDSKMIKVRRFK